MGEVLLTWVELWWVAGHKERPHFLFVCFVPAFRIDWSVNWTIIHDKRNPVRIIFNWILNKCYELLGVKRSLSQCPLNEPIYIYRRVEYNEADRVFILAWEWTPDQTSGSPALQFLGSKREHCFIRKEDLIPFSHPCAKFSNELDLCWVPL
jgi:hypothetical protein